MKLCAAPKSRMRSSPSRVMKMFRVLKVAMNDSALVSVRQSCAELLDQLAKRAICASPPDADFQGRSRAARRRAAPW